MPGRLVKKATYATEYHEIDEEGWRAVRSLRRLERLFFAAFILLAVPHARCTSVHSVQRAPGPDDHSDGAETDYFFLWLYALLSLLLLRWRRPHSSSAR